MAARLDPLDQLVDTLRLQDGVLVAGVALVVDFDHDVGPAAGEQEVRRLVHGAEDGGLVAQALVLTLVEVADDDDHPRPICTVYYSLEPVGIGWAQRAVF